MTGKNRCNNGTCPDEPPLGGILVPFFNVIFLIALMFLPISLAPWPIIWIYSTVILLTEPVLRIAEGIVLLNVVMRKSQSAADEIEKDEESSNLYKGVILLFSSICYGLSAALVYEIYNAGTYNQRICLFVVLCFCLAVHNMMIMAHEGIISDCAFCCLVNIAALYVMMKEVEQRNTHLTESTLWKTEIPTSSWTTIFGGLSASSIFSNILYTNKNKAHTAINIFQRFFSPLFIIGLLIRLYSILFIVKKMTRNFFQDNDDEITLDDLDDDLVPPWRSPLLLKVAVIFMFTQLSVIYLFDWAPGMTKLFWPSDLVVSRLLQIIIVILFYIWRLYRAENWTWNIWLTPN
uniref:Uncharacterized protein n=1 Tax=Biomphalaria glabrata TaxID=6526 RepID=A0A2C9LKP2_BIOGL